MIGIIDYRAGNAPSVYNALERLSIPGKYITRPEELSSVDRVILPGVGSAEATMESLAELDIIDSLTEHVIKKELPFLGICIGMQIVMDFSEEDNIECLKWVKGRVVKFDADKVRIPQIGWNEVSFQKEHPLLEGVPNNGYYYFVNSFHIKPEDRDVVAGTTEYGNTFCSLLIKDNIIASQFHIEKSGDAGLKILQNFARL